MHVIATAGHVDHGKSTLLRALTGMEPDRWAEERRRGMTIDLGFAWTTLPDGTQLAFVDVPGHERFIRNMLAGVGAVPSVLLVVAADGGWMPQTQEHVDVLSALGVQSAVVAVTRSDLADPGPVVADIDSRLAGTTLAGAPVVAVSATTGAGLEPLQAALAVLVRALPPPRTDGPVRLWVDRSFSISGSGTVVTGTLGAGTLHAGDELVLAPSGRRVHVRALQSLGRPAQTVAAQARVAVNLRGVEAAEVVRGDALLTVGSLRTTTEVDVVLGPDASLPSQVTVHVGSAAVGCRVRPLGAGAARLRLDHEMPLQAGDRLLLRDPGIRQVFPADVRDPAPAPLTRRGAAAERALALQSPDGDGELRRRGIARRAEIEALGLRTDVEPVVEDWLVDPERAAELRIALSDLAARHATERPLEPGVPVDAVVRELGLPDRRLVAALASPPLAVRQGLLTTSQRASALPEPVGAAVDTLLSRLRDVPFAAPEAADLAALGLGPRELAAAERAQLLVRLTSSVVLAADAPERAAAVLAGIEQPFGVSEARRALVTTRRVAVPLLELLDRRGATRRMPDDRRVVVPSKG